MVISMDHADHILVDKFIVQYSRTICKIKSIIKKGFRNTSLPSSFQENEGLFIANETCTLNQHAP